MLFFLSKPSFTFMKIFVLLVLTLSACSKDGKPIDTVKDTGSRDGNTLNDLRPDLTEDMDRCPIYISETANSLKQKCTHEIENCYANAINRRRC